MTDLSWPPAAWPPNPFDFGNRAHPDRFAARAKELKALERFATAVGGGETARLLIFGRRGLGKSSLVAKAEALLSTRAIIFGSVTLDSGSASEREFLQETTLSLQRAIIEAGGLDGPGGEFATALERVMLGERVTGENWPLRVASFLAATRTSPVPVRVPDDLVRADLANLADAASDAGSNGLVLLIDEANHLGGQPTTVQRLRNTFLGAPGLSLVLAGTDEVLEAFEAASSPAARHFQKMPVSPLGDIAETYELVTRPLRSVGLPPLLAMERTLSEEVHALAGGSPYEVTLLCHLMYDAMTNASATTMTLSDKVLEDAAGQLMPSGPDQEALATLRSLDPADVQRAARFCVDPGITLQEHALLNLAFVDPSVEAVQAAREAVRSEWERVGAQSLAVVHGERLIPQIGEYGRLYLKYHARVTGDLPSGAEGSYSDRLAPKVLDRIAATASGTDGVHLLRILHRSGANLEGGVEPTLSHDLGDLKAGRIDEVADRLSFFSLLPLLAEQTEHVSDLLLVVVPFEIRENGYVSVLLLHPNEGCSPEELTAALTDSVQSIPGSYRVVSGRAEWARLSSEAWTRLELIFRCRTSMLGVVSLWEHGDRDRALNLAREAASQIAPLDDGSTLPSSAMDLVNAAGFMELVSGHLVEALRYFERCAASGGLSDDRSEEERAILLCNLAAASAGLGQAIDWADAAIRIDLGQRSPGWICVYFADADWPKSPRVVVRPDLIAIARGTRASALASILDDDALSEAEALAGEYPERWAHELLALVGRSVGRNDVYEAATSRAHGLSDGWIDADEHVTEDL